MSGGLKSPYPYFGGKRTIGADIWERLGDVDHYLEPFLGSAAVLLARPNFDATRHREVVNDKDGWIPNFWRAVQADPEAVAQYAEWPAYECDLHARHAWLVGQKDSMQTQLEGDPAWYDAKIAGWWVWGMAQWIGGEFCSGKGPWQAVDGQLVHLGDQGRGIQRKLVHLGDQGRGIQRKRVHLGNQGRGIRRQLVHLGSEGQGIHRQRVHLGNGVGAGNGSQGLLAWMQALAARLERVWVCCGDWARICGPSVHVSHDGVTGVFLDPPYGAEVGRDMAVYTHDSGTVAADVRAWCQQWGQHPRLRIVLCGYDGEHDALEVAGWTKVRWTAHGGYGSQGQGRGRANRHREAYWYSPHCVPPGQLGLW